MGICFSPEARTKAFRIILEENLNTCDKIMTRFGVSIVTARDWAKKSGVGYVSGRRTLNLHDDVCVGEEKTMPQDKNKELPFVEPDPGMGSFKSDKEAANYYRLRAEYLESLYLLADSPTEVKKKTLKQLEERVRERMREEQM